MLLVTIFSIMAFIILNALPDIAGSIALKNAAMGLVSSLLGAGVVGLLWEYGSRRSFTLEMQQNFTSIMDTLSRRAAIASAIENDGLLGATTDFHYEIPWREYIRECSDIDICWWAGKTWLSQNIATLQEQELSTGLTIRYLMPDTRRSDLLTQMHRDSGLSEDILKIESDEAKSILSTFNNGVEIREMARVPRFAMVRLGWRVAFFPYALSPGRNISRPTFILDARKPLGRSFVDDFERLWALAETD